MTRPALSPSVDFTPAPLDPRRDGWPNGPRRLVLFGPPGTGKTRGLLDTWILPAVRDGRRVLACSFTKAAAGEISDRMAKALGLDAEEFRRVSSTIHSEAYRLAREVRPDARCRPPGERFQADAIEEVDAQEDAPAPAKQEAEGELRRAARTVWDYARNVLADQPTIAARLQACMWRFADDQRVAAYQVSALALEVEEYERGKRERNEIDFTDMLIVALNDGYAVERDLLVVDEAQDLSPLQWAVIERWGEHAEQVVICGDPDQAVHRWAGADPTPLLDHARSSDWTARRLAKSYRVPRSAHELARDLILRDHDRLDAPYEPADHEGSVRQADPGDALAALEKAARAGRPALALARSKKVLAQRIGDALARNGVPYLSERGYSPLGAPKAVAAARAILELKDGLATVADVAALLATVPARGHFPAKEKEKVLERLAGWPQDALMRPRSLEALGVFLGAILTVPTLVEAMRLAAVEKPRKSRTSSALSRDRAAELDLLVQGYGPQVLRDRPCVVLTTLHASKGREAEVVVLDLEAPKPVARALATGEGTDDERRLLYVGLTRTKDELVLLRSDVRDLGHLLALGA